MPHGPLPMTLLWAARIAALGTFIALLCLFGSGGTYVERTEGLDAHAMSAIAFHVFTGALAAVAVTLAGTRRRPGDGVAAILAVLLFAWSFGQASLGAYDTVALHIVGALATAMGVTWLLHWSFKRLSTGSDESTHFSTDESTQVSAQGQEASNDAPEHRTDT